MEIKNIKDRIEQSQEFWNKKNVGKKSLAHWKGIGMWKKEARWTEMGDKNLHKFYELVTIVDRNRDSYSKMIEWGVGGGANVLAFAKHFKKIYGVDIGTDTLDECAYQCRKCEIKSFSPILINASNPEKVLDQINTPMDFFFSRAVYQHFPSKEYGVRITEIAYKMLRDKGLAMIQIREDDKSGRYNKEGDYAKNAVRACAYTRNEFDDILTKIGFKIIKFQASPKIQYLNYYLSKG